MLAGQLPYPGPASRAVVAARRRGEMPSLDALRPECAGHGAARRRGRARPRPRAALRRRRRVRPRAGRRDVAGTAGSYRHTAVPPYRRPAVLLLLTALVLGVVALFALRSGHSSAPSALPVARRLAVLPFQNLGRPEDEYFADGITDEIRGKLAALPGLQVTASPARRSTSGPPRARRRSGASWGWTTSSPGRCAGRRTRAAAVCR